MFRYRQTTLHTELQKYCKTVSYRLLWNELCILPVQKFPASSTRSNRRRRIRLCISKGDCTPLFLFSLLFRSILFLTRLSPLVQTILYQKYEFCVKFNIGLRISFFGVKICRGRPLTKKEAPTETASEIMRWITTSL